MRISPRLRHSAQPLVGALLLGLAACNSQPQTIEDGPPDDQKEALAHAKPVELPPAITATKSYRCADSSVVYIDWFSDNKSANLKTSEDGTPTMVKTDTPGQPMTADGGYALSGSATTATIKATVPGKKEQSCNG